MRGQVIVYMGVTWIPLVCKVWEEGESFVLIRTDDLFEAHAKGLLFLKPVGFPLKDVFFHDPAIVETRDHLADGPGLDFQATGWPDSSFRQFVPRHGWVIRNEIEIGV